MPIAILFLVLCAYLYALWALPEIRLPGAIVGGLALVGLGLYLWLAPAPDAESAIDPSTLSLDDLSLVPTTRGATLSGRVMNTSPDRRLREMTLEVRLFDCADPDPEADLADCVTIGEGQAIARPDVPPGQLRAFSAHFVFANLPPLAGVLRWDQRIVSTRATR